MMLIGRIERGSREREGKGMNTEDRSRMDREVQD